jgi:hypothetical protein
MLRQNTAAIRAQCFLQSILEIIVCGSRLTSVVVVDTAGVLIKIAYISITQILCRTFLEVAYRSNQGARHLQTSSQNNVRVATSQGIW